MKPSPTAAPAALACLLGLGLAAGPLAALDLSGFDEAADRLADQLRFAAPELGLTLTLRGQFDAELYFSDQRPPGLVFADDQFYLQPRATGVADVFWGPFQARFKGRWDRGVDPGAAPGGERRAEEYWLQAQLVPQALAVRAGKTATVFGNFIGRHEAWDHPFLHAPLPYEHVTTLPNQSASTAAALITNRDRADRKGAWVPLIWGAVYSPGVQAHGSVGRVSYAVQAVTAPISSHSFAWHEWNLRHPVWTGRVAWNDPAGWSAGLSYSQGPYVLPGREGNFPAGFGRADDTHYLAGLDFAYAHRWFQLWAEVVASRFETAFAGDLDALAWYVEARRKLSPQLFLAGRLGQQYFNEIDLGDGRRARWDYNVWRAQLGLTWRPSRHLQLKLEYGHTHLLGAPAQQGPQMLAAALSFRL